jgi:hypothetical protein
LILWDNRPSFQLLTKEPAMPPAKKSTLPFEAFEAAVSAARGPGGKSSLYRWLRANYDEFFEMWDEGADWPTYVQAFVDLGLTDRKGKPPALATARKTWLQVRQDVAKRKTRKKGKFVPVPAPGEIAVGVRAVQDLPEPAGIRPRVPMKLEIRPSRPRVEAPETGPALPSSQALASASAAPANQISTPVTVSTEDLDADTRRLYAQMNAKKVPMPKPV